MRLLRSAERVRCSRRVSAPDCSAHQLADFKLRGTHLQQRPEQMQRVRRAEGVFDSFVALLEDCGGQEELLFRLLVHCGRVPQVRNNARLHDSRPHRGANSTPIVCSVGSSDSNAYELTDGCTDCHAIKYAHC